MSGYHGKFRSVTSTILVVDDDPETRMLLSEFLTEHGFIVHVARDGRHALQVLGHLAPPDLILLDYQMPVMSGKHFLARRRRNPRLRRIPVVLLSAWTRIWSPTSHDAVEVLSKPVDPERLLALVRRICAGAASLQIHERATDRFRRTVPFSRAPETGAARRS